MGVFWRCCQRLLSSMTHGLGICVQLSPPSGQRLLRARKHGRVSMEEYQDEPVSDAVAVKRDVRY